MVKVEATSSRFPGKLLDATPKGSKESYPRPPSIRKDHSGYNVGDETSVFGYILCT